MRKWILEKIVEDDANAASASRSTKTNSDDGKLWPDKDLVGMTGDEAKVAVLAGDSSLFIQIVPHDAMVTMDFREDRVRIFVFDDGKVARQPMIG